MLIYSQEVRVMLWIPYYLLTGTSSWCKIQREDHLGTNYLEVSYNTLWLKAKSLTKVGRLMPIPCSAATKLEVMQRIVGVFGDNFKYHLVNLDIVKQSFPKGSLNIRDLTIFNEVLFGKWLCKYMNRDLTQRHLTQNFTYIRHPWLLSIDGLVLEKGFHPAALLFGLINMCEAMRNSICSCGIMKKIHIRPVFLE